MSHEHDDGAESDSSEEDFDDLALWRRPEMRQSWVKNKDGSGKHNSAADREEERVASTNDLVLDLIFVVLLARIGVVFRENLELANTPDHPNITPFTSLRNFVILFVPMWMSWYTPVVLIRLRSTFLDCRTPRLLFTAQAP